MAHRTFGSCISLRCFRDAFIRTSQPLLHVDMSLRLGTGTYGTLAQTQMASIATPYTHLDMDAPRALGPADVADVVWHRICMDRLRTLCLICTSGSISDRYRNSLDLPYYQHICPPPLLLVDMPDRHHFSRGAKHHKALTIYFKSMSCTFLSIRWPDIDGRLTA